MCNLSSADAFQKTKCIHGFRRFRIKYLEKHLSQYAQDDEQSQAIEKIISYRCAKELQSLQEELNNPDGNIETIKNCIKTINSKISSVTNNKPNDDQQLLKDYINAFQSLYNTVSKVTSDNIDDIWQKSVDISNSRSSISKMNNINKLYSKRLIEYSKQLSEYLETVSKLIETINDGELISLQEQIIEKQAEITKAAKGKLGWISKQNKDKPISISDKNSAMELIQSIDKYRQLLTKLQVIVGEDSTYMQASTDLQQLEDEIGLCKKIIQMTENKQYTLNNKDKEQIYSMLQQNQWVLDEKQAVLILNNLDSICPETVTNKDKQLLYIKIISNTAKSCCFKNDNLQSNELKTLLLDSIPCVSKYFKNSQQLAYAICLTCNQLGKNNNQNVWDQSGFSKAIKDKCEGQQYGMSL